MTDELRVLVVDDEAMARRRVQRLLSALPGVSVVGELSDGVDVPARVEAGDVDLVLLDIEMRELSGLDALRLMPTGGPLVVFVTAHAEHALAAFDGGALDYVLKPVDPARLKTALERAKERLGARRAAPEGPAPSGPDDRLAVPTRRGLVVLEPKEIQYALVDGESVLLHTERGTFVTDFRLVALEKRLAPRGFVRAHRRVLLNLEHVRTLDRVGGTSFVAELTDGAQVPVSRRAARALQERWKLD